VERLLGKQVGFNSPRLQAVKKFQAAIVKPGLSAGLHLQILTQVVGFKGGLGARPHKIRELPRALELECHVRFCYVM